MSTKANSGEQKKRAAPRAKATGLRAPGDWKAERPLTYHYREERMKDLAALAKAYIDRHIDHDALMKLVPKETNWLKDSEQHQFPRCRGKKNVLLVLGWCPKYDAVINLDQDPKEACLTEQLVMCVEHITGKPVCFLDFFKECERTGNDDGCQGREERVQENTIHSIALLVELTVAMREFDIEFCGVWGFAKLFQVYVDQAVFPKLPLMKDIPRVYHTYHIGKIADKVYQKRRELALATMETLGLVVGMGKVELYGLMKDWFDSRPELTFRLPDIEIERRTKVGDNIDKLFSAVTWGAVQQVISSVPAGPRSSPSVPSPPSEPSPPSDPSPPLSIPSALPLPLPWPFPLDTPPTAPTSCPLFQFAYPPKPTLFDDVWQAELATRKRIADAVVPSPPEKKKRKTADS